MCVQGIGPAFQKNHKRRAGSQKEKSRTAKIKYISYFSVAVTKCYKQDNSSRKGLHWDYSSREPESMVDEQQCQQEELRFPHFKLQAENMRIWGIGGGFLKLWPSLQWHTYSNKETPPNPSQTVQATGNQVLQTLNPIRKWLVSTIMDLHCHPSRISLPGHWYDGNSVHSWVKILIILSSSLYSMF